MVNSLAYMFREISLTQQIPNQLITMRIKSIHKTGSKLLMDNGSFPNQQIVNKRLFGRIMESWNERERGKYTCYIK